MHTVSYVVCCEQCCTFFLPPYLFYLSFSVTVTLKWPSRSNVLPYPVNNVVEISAANKWYPTNFFSTCFKDLAGRRDGIVRRGTVNENVVTSQLDMPTRKKRHTIMTTSTCALFFSYAPDLLYWCCLWSPYVIGRPYIFLPCSFYLISSSIFPFFLA